MTRIGPFPGMDPWLESRWSGMHHLLISMIQKQLNPRLRPMGLLARIEERVYVESLDEPGGFRSPDVAGIRRLTKPVNQPADSAVAISDEPYVVRIVDDPVTLGHVEIVAVADQAKVITAIEVLSPTNKIDPRARREYLRKRDEYRAARVSIVEIDLIRDGMPLSLGTLDLIPPERRTTCSVWVHRGWKPGLELEYYAVPLRSRLPTIRVPLRPADTEVVVALQTCFDEAYEQGGYDATDYDRAPRPPLSPDDAAWAAERIATWKKGIEDQTQ